MIQLLDTQKNELRDVIDSTRFDQRDFELDEAGPYPIIRFTAAPTQIFFAIDDRSREGTTYRVNYAPAAIVDRISNNVSGWSGVVAEVRQWLRFIGRELAASDRRFIAAAAPDWAIQELPPEYATLSKHISELQERQRRIGRMAGLLWDTGEPLNKLVRDAFRAAGYAAEVTSAGATYDVEVQIDSTARLLVEVTGINGQITKDSKKIAQVLATKQLISAPRDRVAVAVNAYREQPLHARAGREIATPEAIALIAGLGATVFTTADLFQVWKTALSNVAAAARQITAILEAPPGVVRIQG